MADPTIEFLRQFIADNRPFEMFPGASLMLGKKEHSPRDVIARAITGSDCEVVANSPEATTLRGKAHGMVLLFVVRFERNPPVWAEVRELTILSE